MKKNNIKRAFKTISKMNNNYTNILYFDLKNGNKVVTDGKVIVTVDSREFEENKEFLKNLVYRDFSELLIKEFKSEMETVRTTSLVINTNDGLAMRIIKAGRKRLGAINEAYNNILSDCGCNVDYMVTRKTDVETIKNPILYGVFDGEKNICQLSGLCPVAFNVKECLTSILE